MFSQVGPKVEHAVYGIMAYQDIGGHRRFDWGTGFFVDEHYFISVAHICFPEGNINANMHTHFYLLVSDGTGTIHFHPLKMIDHDTDLDISLFESEDAYEYIRSSDETVKLGESVCSYGYHYLKYYPDRNHFDHFFPKLKSGVVANPDIDQFFLVDTIMYKGSSGCPLLNTNGDLVGIQCQNLTDPETNEYIDFSLALKLENIKHFLSKNHIIF